MKIAITLEGKEYNKYSKLTKGKAVKLDELIKKTEDFFGIKYQTLSIDCKVRKNNVTIHFSA